MSHGRPQLSKQLLGLCVGAVLYFGHDPPVMIAFLLRPTHVTAVRGFGGMAIHVHGIDARRFEAQQRVHCMADRHGSAALMHRLSWQWICEGRFVEVPTCVC